MNGGTILSYFSSKLMLFFFFPTTTSNHWRGCTSGNWTFCENRGCFQWCMYTANNRNTNKNREIAANLIYWNRLVQKLRIHSVERANTTPSATSPSWGNVWMSPKSLLNGLCTKLSSDSNRPHCKIKRFSVVWSRD